MKLGHAIQTLVRSEKESDRIIFSILEGKGKPFEIYNKYSIKIKDQQLWAKAHRDLKISGFRPGKANHIILSKIPTGLKNNDVRSLSVFWMLYRCCVVDFVVDEHNSLNNLLLEKDLEGDSDSTVAILQGIAKYIPLYEIEVEAVEELYEAWWFERVEGFNELFSGFEVDLKIVRELLVKSEKKLNVRVDDVSKKMDLFELSIKNGDAFKVVKNKIEALNNLVSELKEELELEGAKADKKAIELIDVKLSGIEERIRKEEGDVKGSSLHPDLENKISENEEKIFKLDEKIKALVDRKNIKDRKRKENYGDGNIFVNGDVFYNGVCSVFSDVVYKKANSEIIKDVLNEFNCFYVDSDSIFRAICKEIISQNRVKELIVGPSFLDFSCDGSQEFRDYDVIYIKNIGGCFIEGFLIPILMKSCSQIEINFPKVFVLHDDDVNSKLVSKIKKHTIDINYSIMDVVRNLNCTQAAELSFDVEGLDKVEVRHKDFLSLMENSGVKLNQLTFERFARLSQLMSKRLDERDSLMVSAQAVVFPFIESYYGETKLDVIREILSGVL